MIHSHFDQVLANILTNFSKILTPLKVVMEKLDACMGGGFLTGF
jgi:hypothetical protein